MPAGLRARVIADCKAAAVTLTAQQPWTAPAKPAAPSWDPVKAQVREICAGIEMSKTRISARRALQKRVSFTDTYCADLRKYAAEVQSKPSASRSCRHYLTDQAERRVKLIDETGFDLSGVMCEPPQEEWARPSAMGLYHRLMLRDPGSATIREFDVDDLQHLAWLVDAELADITDDDRVHLLSDPVLPEQRKYPGAPVPDDRARIGLTHAAEDVQGLVMEVWGMIRDGHPPMDIPTEHRREMTAGAGLRVSGRLIAAQVNRLIAARIDARCNCLGRDQVRNAWDLPDHGEGCQGRERYLSVEVVRRAIRQLMVDGTLTRTDSAHLTRRGHAEHRIPAAYEIPADAGWHDYATRGRAPRRKPRSKLRDRLLGEQRPAPEPAPPPPPLDPAWDFAA
jgi:hypothetical protein